MKASGSRASLDGKPVECLGGVVTSNPQVGMFYDGF